MFKLFRVISGSFPGVSGIQKSLSAVQKVDQKMHDYLGQLPQELTRPSDYIPAINETPLEIVRRYTIACIAQGFFLTLHRPYSSVSEASRISIGKAAWLLASYQAQLVSLSAILEPFAWFIEEFLDPHLFRGVAVLGARLTREPGHPLATTIISQVQAMAEQSKRKVLRKRDYAKVFGISQSILVKYVEMGLLQEVQEPRPSSAEPVLENAPDENPWGMEDVLMESGFKWDDYLVDPVMDTSDPSNSARY